jgi:hypothetical protein
MVAFVVIFVTLLRATGRSPMARGVVAPGTFPTEDVA